MVSTCLAWLTMSTLEESCGSFQGRPDFDGSLCQYMPAGTREMVELEHPQRQSEASKVRLILRRGLAQNCHRKLRHKFSSLFNVCAVSLSAECEREDAALGLDVFVGGCKPKAARRPIWPRFFTNPLHCRSVTYHSLTRLY